MNTEEAYEALGIPTPKQQKLEELRKAYENAKTNLDRKILIIRAKLLKNGN